MEQAAQVRSDPDFIRRHAGKPGDEKVSFTGRDKGILLLCGGILLASLALQWVITVVGGGSDTPLLEKLRGYNRGVSILAVILVLSRLLEVIGLGRIGSPIARFNLRRVLRLLVGLAIAFVVISVLFVNWYAAVVSLGLISLLLSFSLQTPISSFVGWIYILVRAPYRIGDRIRIGEVRGDVIDVSYFDTALWEFGEYLSSDHPTGRVIRFPNSMVFGQPVINYSWPLFPYIWNEIKFQVAYDADLDFISHTMTEIATEELGDTMKESVSVYRDILAKTPVDHLDVKEQPSVFFRVSDNTWLEAIVRYLVPPKDAGRVKNRLTTKMLQALNKEPERSLFPKSNMR